MGTRRKAQEEKACAGRRDLEATGMGMGAQEEPVGGLCTDGRSATRAELEESRQRQRRLEAESAEHALDIRGMKGRVGEQQTRQRWRSLQLAAEAVVREDEEQLEALLVRAVREAKRWGARQ